MNLVANHISYRGEVTARLDVGNDPFIAVLKNSGTPALWKALALSMTGQDISSYAPRYFNIVKRKLGEPDENALLRKVKLTGITYDNSVDGEGNVVSWNTNFIAVVTKSDKSGKIDSSQTAVLQLCNLDSEVLAEICDTDRKLANIFNNVAVGVDAVYEWKMIFSNKDESEETINV